MIYYETVCNNYLNKILYKLNLKFNFEISRLKMFQCYRDKLKRNKNTI